MVPYITFISRNQAQNMVPLPNSVIVSFYDISEEPATLHEDWKAICRIRCHNKDTPTLGLELFNDEMANKIASFAKDHFDTADHFYVHCQLGQSRSGATALAISEFFNVPCYKEKLPVTTFSYTVYNKLVYRKTLLALYDEKDYE